MTNDPAEQEAVGEREANHPESMPPNRRRISLELPVNLLAKLDTLKSEWGVRSRGDALQRVLQQIFDEEGGAEDGGADAAPDQPDLALTKAPLDGDQEPAGQQTTFLEASALVLLEQSDSSELDYALAYDEPTGSPPPRRARGPSIDLPGFVRKNADRLRHSLKPDQQPAPGAPTPMALFSSDQLQAALDASHRHWLDLYGKPANAAVLEASMQWLARDVWPESDSSEGRPFTWSLAQQVVSTLAPSWSAEAASFERVIVMAGILEDPFSGNTLAVRVPTLIRRFVQRVRQRRSGGTSFNTLQETMTLHGALKLLSLPTAAGQRLTKDQIRDAFRQQALNHHPDSGGSADMMRRLNEAYQLLKDQYGART